MEKMDNQVMTEGWEHKDIRDFEVPREKMAIPEFLERTEKKERWVHKEVEDQLESLG